MGAHRRRLRLLARRTGLRLDLLPERQQLRSRHRRVHACRGRGASLEHPLRHVGRRCRDLPGQRAAPDDRRRHASVRRPGHAVRHHDQRLAHVPQQRPHQRVESVLGVHAPRRQRLQPRQPESHALRGRRRELRRRVVHARSRHRHHGAGHRRRLLELPHGSDHEERARVPRARPGLREPGRAPHVARPAVRLRRRPRVCRRRHGADVRPGIPALGAGRGRARPLRGVCRESRRAAAGDRQAPRPRPQAESHLRAARSACGGPGDAGTRRSPWRAITECATRRSPSSPRRERLPS